MKTISYNIKREVRLWYHDTIRLCLCLYYTSCLYIWVVGNIIFPTTDEFSHRLNLNSLMASNLTKKSRTYYLNKLMYFRNKAHIRDL